MFYVKNLFTLLMRKRKVVGSALVGNIVEYYDFGIYAVYAKTIGALFFPAGDEYTQILMTLSVFAVGFLMRPIGGMVFGHIGDIFGRKVALTISIVLMAICTMAIGLLPTYATIGIFAPILLVLIRLVQGICVGGESAGSAIFILEHLEGYKPGFVGSIVMASNMMGTLLANFVGILIASLFSEHEYAWRFGFLLGGLMGLTGLYMRYNVSETPVFQAKKEENLIVKSPLLDAINKSWRRLLVVCFLGGVTAALAYMVRGYFNVYFEFNLKYDKVTAGYFTSFALFAMIIMMPFFGILADKIGYRKFLYITCYVIIFSVIPIFMMITEPSHDISKVVFAIFLFAMLASAICAPAYPYAISAFAPELRYSGVAVSWNIGIALFGGTTPAISGFLVKNFGINAPALYIVAMCTCFIIISFLTRRDKH